MKVKKELMKALLTEFSEREFDVDEVRKVTEAIEDYVDDRHTYERAKTMYTAKIIEFHQKNYETSKKILEKRLEYYSISSITMNDL